MFFDSWSDIGRVFIVGVLAYAGLIFLLRISAPFASGQYNIPLNSKTYDHYYHILGFCCKFDSFLKRSSESRAEHDLAGFGGHASRFV